jgi:hypothetical protein
MKTFANGLLLAGFFWSLTASASIITYSDRTAWSMAAGPTVLDDFNDLASGSRPLTTQSADAGDFTVSTSGGWSVVFGNRSIDGTIGGGASTSTVFTLAFTFDSPINAFGIDVQGWNDDTDEDGIDELRTVVFADSSRVPVTTQVDQGVRFFGFTSTDDFRVVNFTGVPGVSGDAWAFDNLAYSRSEVPAPSTFLCFLSGVLGLIAKHRCDHKRQSGPHTG